MGNMLKGCCHCRCFKRNKKTKTTTTQSHHITMMSPSTACCVETHVTKTGITSNRTIFVANRVGDTAVCVVCKNETWRTAIFKCGAVICNECAEARVSEYGTGVRCPGEDCNMLLFGAGTSDELIEFSSDEDEGEESECAQVQDDSPSKSDLPEPTPELCYDVIYKPSDHSELTARYVFYHSADIDVVVVGYDVGECGICKEDVSLDVIFECGKCICKDCLNDIIFSARDNENNPHMCTYLMCPFCRAPFFSHLPAMAD